MMSAKDKMPTYYLKTNWFFNLVALLPRVLVGERGLMLYFY